MKIILVNPETKFPGKSPSIPLGLLQVAALPYEKEHEIEILDCNKTSAKNVKRRIKMPDPDVVGFTGWTGESLKSCVELSKFSRANTNAKIVWGGVHASLLPQQVIKEDYLDFIVVGEGDFVFGDLVENLDKPERVKGIAYKDKGKPKFNLPGKIPEKLDTLPMIPWDLIPIKNYVFKWVGGLRTFALPTSRGCPYNCKFCYNKLFYEKGWRPYSVERVKGNLEKLLSGYPNVEALRIDYEDNLIGTDKKRAMEISSMFKKYDLRWGCQLRVNDVDRKMLEKFKENGCEYIFFGVESGSQRILNFLRKGTTLKQVVNVFDICNEIGIRAVASFMLDIPTETKDEIVKTVKLAKRLNSIVNVGFYQPYPGTELFNFVVKNGFKPPETTEGWSRFSFSSKHGFSEANAIELKFAYYYINYLLNPIVLAKKKDYDTFFVLLKTVLRV